MLKLKMWMRSPRVRVERKGRHLAFGRNLGDIYIQEFQEKEKLRKQRRQSWKQVIVKLVLSPRARAKKERWPPVTNAAESKDTEHSLI